MKSRLIIATLLFSVFFISCKKEEKAQPEPIVEEVKNIFKTSLNIVVKKDDNLHLYFTEDGSTNFTEENSVWVDVKGSETAQDVTFQLGENRVPTQLRLDFGIAKDQEPIVINSFAMNYLNKEFKIPGNQFLILFDPDLTKTIFDKNTATVTAVVKDGVRQSPSFYPNTKPLGDEINKLVK